jgi:hypothetical protein
VEIAVIKVDISCFYHSQFVSAKVRQLYYDDSTDLLRFGYKIKGSADRNSRILTAII